MQLKKIIVLGFVLLFQNTNAEGFCQQIRVAADSIPSREMLFLSLRTFHQQETGAKVAPVKIGKKYSWLRWMPTFGISYNVLADRPRPNLGFSFAQIFQNLEDREKRKIENLKILRGSALAFKTDSIEVETLLENREALIENWESKLKALQESLKSFEDVAVLEIAEFRNEEKREKEGLILPSNWIKIQAAFIRSQYPLLAKREEIRIYEASKFEELRNLDAEVKKKSKM